MASIAVVDILPSNTNRSCDLMHRNFLYKINHTDVEIQEIILLLCYFLHNNVFEFEDHFYKRNSGFSIESTLFPIQ